MFHKLHKASRLSSTDWLYFFEAWFWLLVFDLGLRTCPFSSLQAYAARLSARSASPEQVTGLILALKAAVDHARWNHLSPMTCLRRSLSLQKMLARRGIVTELKIGVRKEKGVFDAHAWLEYQGEPLGESKYMRESLTVMNKDNLDFP